ncbi:MAG TPA: aspartate--tRNA ligase [Pyrinomonadaceae bacterium]|nr:aspartate--tRNA ligase [Acidobacteriota bacterium]HQZ95308.1 aspartate--tRNA ligase [Pyrinomonadaceae bacterium]
MLDVLGTLERTHTCGELRDSDVGKQVVLMGWVAKKRDFGVFTFVDLRDRDGVTQVVVSEEDAKEAHAKAKNLRGEFVIAVKGEVVKRDEGAKNAKLPTGEIEVKVSEILILNDANVLPFQLEVAGSENLAAEDTRLKYRYLDLRRPQLQHNIRMRAKAVSAIREYFDTRGFIEIETPILLKSTPEGARDFIVPSRIHTGKFFALPQSPQILKQLTMISGFDKYYQIARCFRDEDLRADRQPEFTQLDMEMTFAHQEMAYREIQGMFNHVLGKVGGIDLPTEWPRMTYAEAMRRYGSDKPDLRFEMELVDLSDELRDTDFAPFAQVLNSGGQAGSLRSGEIKCIVAKGKADYSRKQLDDLQEFAKRYGAGALAWIKVGDETTSSLLKVLGEEKIGQLVSAAGAEKGDLVLIVAGRKSVVAASLGALRIEVAKRENLIDRSAYKPLIVTEFPMFEHDEETDSYAAAHHPFTSPMDEDLEKFKTAVNDDSQHHLLGEVRAKAYDAVINGYECAGGSIRIHQKDIQALNFKALGLSVEKARERFGFFLDALEYGTPPHGGFAAGIERTCMILCGTENIRDVMAFPKTASAQDLMMDSPGEVDGSQLKELGIEVSD